MFGILLAIPLGIACFFYGRPLRFGLALGAVLLVQTISEFRGQNILYSDRTYFGILRVMRAGTNLGEYTSLRHGTTLHGQNFRWPKEEKDWGNPDKDYHRLANTYYHRRGPVGAVMENFNWFSRDDRGRLWAIVKDNDFKSDARMPASIVGLGGDPMSQLVNLWSEPPYAVIGLGTGTMASYARLGQMLHYYEIDNQVRRLSEEIMHPDGRPMFTYVKDARDRGAAVWIMMGDARLKMAQPYKMYDPDHAEQPPLLEKNGGAEKFYHMMVVDAFSSDAIPVHLLTKEAMQMYFAHLVEDGILCVHTSNRHLALVDVVADIANDLGYACLRGRDNAKESADGHSTSEWVMVARQGKYLSKLQVPRNYDQGSFWETPGSEGTHVWTDDYSNLMGVFNEFRGGRQR
jgi:hypothetical protein